MVGKCVESQNSRGLLVALIPRGFTDKAKSEQRDTARLRREREERIERAFDTINKSARRASRTYLGQGFSVGVQTNCHHKWPSLTLRVQDLDNPTANTPYVQFRANDLHETAMLEVITKIAQEQISLLDDGLLTRLPYLVDGWIDSFLDNAKTAAADLHEHNQQTVKQRHDEHVVAIEVEGGLNLKDSEAEDVRRILRGIFGAGADQPEEIIIDHNFELPPEEAERVRRQRAEHSGSTTRILASSKHTVVADRYSLEKLLGTGGMGAVFLAQDQREMKKVAIKILHPTLADDQKVLHRFFREVQLIKRVKHPNVISVFDSGSYERVIFYTMEHVDGLPLHKLLQGRRIRAEILCDFALQVAEGLNAIHRANIVHRDLKAENVVITQQRRVKIIDFGIARPEDSNLTTVGEVIGSPAYLAPELWQGKPPTPASDIYATGIIFYRMITGSLPYTGDNPIAIMNKHLHEVPRIPAAAIEKTPPWFVELIMNLLEKDPAKRPTLDQIIVTLKSNLANAAQPQAQ